MADKFYVDRHCDTHAHGRVVTEEGKTVTVYARPVVEGKPIAEHEAMVWVDPPDSTGAQAIRHRYANGPSKVASASYRANYDAIFGQNKAAN